MRALKVAAVLIVSLFVSTTAYAQAAIATARVYHGLMALVPGIVLSGTQDVGGLAGPATVTYAIHGGRASEGRVELDGLSTGSSLGGSGVSFYVADIANAQEVAISTS